MGLAFYDPTPSVEVMPLPDPAGGRDYLPSSVLRGEQLNPSRLVEALDVHAASSRRIRERLQNHLKLVIDFLTGEGVGFAGMI